MGFSISWLALKGKAKAEVLSALALVDTGARDEANESPISGAELPGGWYLVFLNDVSHRFVDPDSAEKLSVGTSVLTCQVEEHVMASIAAGYEDGRIQWAITHEWERGRRHLDSQGELPRPYEEVRARLFAEQDEADAKSSPVDCIWDIPVTVAYEICGYRHDNLYLKSGEEPIFTTLEPA